VSHGVLALLVLCSRVLSQPGACAFTAEEQPGSCLPQPEQEQTLGASLLQQHTRLGQVLKHSLNVSTEHSTVSAAAEYLRSIQCHNGEDSLMVLKTESLDKSSLDKALELGAKFLISRQKSEGNFHYEYDWEKQQNSDDDNSVRQAGTTWGLAFLHADAPNPELSQAVLKALKFFAQYSVEGDHGSRFVRYPGEPEGKLGTIALLALAHIDFLRSQPQISNEEKKTLQHHLEGYIKFLLHAETSVGNGKHKNHVFHGKYTHSGKPIADDSAYFDGEALLALVRAARHSSQFKDLWETIPRVARGGWMINAEHGLKKGDKVKEKDLKRLKGFYQWSSMAMYELLQTDSKKFEPFQQHILNYADWRLASVKYPLDAKEHNIAVTLEGLVPAYLVALRAKDSQRSDKIGCLLRKAIKNLNIMQVGHPEAEGGALKASKDDRHAFGGVQPSRNSPKLRIDTTQHQMHAVMQIKQMLTSSQHDPLLF